VSWARDAVAAIRKIVLIEERMEGLTAQVKHLADGYTDVDRRLLRLKAKCDLMEKMAAWAGGLCRQNRNPIKIKKKTS